MSETKLFPSESCDGYFGIKRFDRENYQGKVKRIHTATVAALLELDFEQPSLDYHSLMKLTRLLCMEAKEGYVPIDDGYISFFVNTVCYVIRPLNVL